MSLTEQQQQDILDAAESNLYDHGGASEVAFSQRIRNRFIANPTPPLLYAPKDEPFAAAEMVRFFISLPENYRMIVIKAAYEGIKYHNDLPTDTSPEIVEMVFNSLSAFMANRSEE
jgi:hypothetical protein